MECSGVDHVVLVDVHVPQLEGFFRIPVDNVSAVPTLLVHMATEYARRLRKSLVLLHKRRESETETAVTHIVGDVRGQTCLLVDDMISTEGTVAESAAGVRQVFVTD